MLERRNAVWDVSAEKCWEIWMQKNICKNQKCQTFWHSIQKAKGQSLTSKQFAEPRASSSRGQSLKISISTKKAETPDQSRSLHEPCAAVRHSNRAGGCSMLPTFQFWNKRAYKNNCNVNSVQEARAVNLWKSASQRKKQRHLINQDVCMSLARQCAILTE